MKKIDQSIFNQTIARKFLFGQQSKDIAEQLEVSPYVVSRMTRIYESVRDQDWDLAIKIVTQQSVGLEPFKWAAESFGIQIPDSIEAAYNGAREKKNALYPSKKAIPEEADKIPVDAPAEVTAGNEAVYLIRILEELHTHNELMKDLLDVVIPKYVADLKDNMNANTDVVTERLKNMEQALDGIRCNVRKRGL